MRQKERPKNSVALAGKGENEEVRSRRGFLATAFDRSRERERLLQPPRSADAVRLSFTGTGPITPPVHWLAGVPLSG
jgi:hypothetical protein